MKNLNFLAILLLSITLFTCDNDDDNSTTDTPAINLDITAVIAKAPGTDITNFVTLNGQNAALYSTELTVGSSLRIGRPESLGINDLFTYSDITIFLDDNGELIEVDFDTETFISDDGLLQYVVPAGQPANYFDLDEVSVIELKSVGVDAQMDLDYKYTLEVFIGRDNVTYGPYLIDPKIRIKSLN